jgi:transposase InsO family protein
MKYRNYDPMVKKLITESRNRNLFPELNIPRTTINYWLNHSKELVTTDKISTYEVALKNVDKELYKEKAKSFIMKECMKHTFKNSEFYDYKSKKTRKFIIDLIEDYKEILAIKEIIDCLGISNLTYYRWRSEILGCTYNDNKKCSVSRPSQLTMEEQRKLVQFARSKQFKKFSTVSFMYYCKRKNLLNCSLESWYKYLRLYGIDRRNRKFKKIRYSNGLRAKNVDEYWHLDITEIKYGVNSKAYLQIVVDNYSRMIVGWKLSLNKKMKLTYNTLIKSFKVSPNFQGKIISDKGTENTGVTPSKLLLGRGIKQLIAKVDIHYSNSMVEAVFRQLKQKFLVKVADSYKILYRLLYKFVHQYNNIIPHTMLLGATPTETYYNEFDRDKFIQDFKTNSDEVFKSRKISFKKCQKCYKKNWNLSR